MSSGTQNMCDVGYCRTVNYEFERMWNDTILSLFETLFQHLFGGTVEADRNLRRVGVLADIRTGNSPHSSQERKVDLHQDFYFVKAAVVEGIQSCEILYSACTRFKSQGLTPR